MINRARLHPYTSGFGVGRVYNTYTQYTVRPREYSAYLAQGEEYNKASPFAAQCVSAAGHKFITLIITGIYSEPEKERQKDSFGSVI